MRNVNWVLVGLAAFWLTALAGCNSDDSEPGAPPVPTVGSSAAASPSAPPLPTDTAVSPNEQTPIDTPRGTWPEDLGYRVVLSGPATAVAGSDVTYVIRSDCVRQSPPCQGFSIEFAWSQGAATMVRSSFPGAPGITKPQNVVWSVMEAGTIEVTLRISPDFDGEMVLIVGPLVSNAHLSEGSVLEMRTKVSRGNDPQ